MLGSVLVEVGAVKVRRVVVEVEVPYEYDGAFVLEMLRSGFLEHDGPLDVPHQAQAACEAESDNRRIGVMTDWPYEDPGRAFARAQELPGICAICGGLEPGHEQMSHLVKRCLCE